MQTVNAKYVYDALATDLQSWIGSNRRTNKYISRHNLKYLFELTDSRELTIDLCRFDVGYYTKVFAGAEGLKMSEEFVKKACVVMRETLKRVGKPEMEITISVKHKVSRITHWQTLYITPKFTPESMKPLVRKPDER
ncbi:hypothetical protein [Mucilaginibacter sp.]|uniref:hypothetical protein n=1 Tax=Mucilaginibacter sp. TaxID=1882438 RepID=UPI0025E672F3|nr:hypothetical protein [Mucilaginibacter sp.]